MCDIFVTGGETGGKVGVTSRLSISAPILVYWIGIY